MAESFKEFFCDRSFVPNVVEHSWEIAINVREVSVAVLRIDHSGSDFCFPEAKPCRLHRFELRAVPFVFLEIYYSSHF